MTARNISLNTYLLIALVCACALLLAPHRTEAAGISKPPNNLSLKGYWSFNEAGDSDSYIGDYSGRGNHATSTGTKMRGKRGRAQSFDGATTYAKITPTSGLPIYGTTGYTVAFWVKGVSGQADKRVFSESSTASNNAIFSLGINSSDKMDVFLRNSAGTALRNHTSSTAVAYDDTWHHIVWTDSNGTTALYIDGVRDATNFDYTPAGTYGFDRETIAGMVRNAGAESLFAGSVDEVRLYSRVLSASEAVALYNSGAVKIMQPSRNGLVGYWSMDEGTGSRVGDSSGYNSLYNLGYSLTGTTTGSPTWVSSPRGKALSFSGSNHVDIPPIPVGASGGMLLTLWFKTTNSAATAQMLASQVVAGGAGWYAYIASGFVAFCTQETVDFECETTTAAFNDGKWHQAQFFAFPDPQDIFIDGVDQPTSPAGSGTVTDFSSTNNIQIGNDVGGSTVNFTGSIDEVRLYDANVFFIQTGGEAEGLYPVFDSPINGKVTAKTVSNNGLLGYWSLNEGTGSRIGDFSGNSYTGTTTASPSWVSSVRGKALDFNGSTQYAGISAPATVADNLSSMTVSMWLKTTNSAAQMLITKVNNNANDPGWMLQKNSTGSAPGTLSFYTQQSGGNWHGRMTNNRYDDGKWHHFAVTLSGGGGGTITLYVDGVAVSMTADDSGTVSTYTNSNAIKFATMGDLSGQFFTGSLDEVRIYNRVLSATEIWTLANY